MAEAKNEALNYDKVWAMFQESDRQWKEAKEQFKETDRKLKETGQYIGKLTDRFGDVVEHMVIPGIIEKFNALGFHFNRDCHNAKFREAGTGELLTEVDILLENGDIVIAIEVKSKLDYKDVDSHIRRMDIISNMADTRRDNRKYLGALASAIVSKEIKAYAEKIGFYVLEQSGDTMKLEIPEGFFPRAW